MTTSDDNKPNRELLDGSQPFQVLWYQTAQKDIDRRFEGPNYKADIKEAATALAIRGITAFVLTPTQKYTPPPESVVGCEELDFSTPEKLSDV